MRYMYTYMVPGKHPNQSLYSLLFFDEIPFCNRFFRSMMSARATKAMRAMKARPIPSLSSLKPENTKGLGYDPAPIGETGVPGRPARTPTIPFGYGGGAGWRLPTPTVSLR